MLKTPIKLPILYNTVQTAKLEELEIEVSLDDCDVRNQYFYSIDSAYHKLLQKSDNVDPTRSCIWSGGQSFIVNLPLKQVIEIVNNAIKNDSK